MIGGGSGVIDKHMADTKRKINPETLISPPNPVLSSILAAYSEFFSRALGSGRRVSASRGPQASGGFYPLPASFPSHHLILPTWRTRKRATRLPLTPR